jgi:LiaI-LiaF-like transmembrane region/N-terminal domain of toast_rack, DUF2154
MSEESTSSVSEASTSPVSEESASPVRQNTQRHGLPGLTWAVILIGVGVVALLNNLNIPGFSINFLDLLRFWPVILILLGLDILVGRRSVFGSLGVAVLAVVVIGGLVWLTGSGASQFAGAGTSVTRDISQTLDGAKSLTVNLKLGAGETHIKPLSSSDKAIEGTYRTNTNLQVDVTYERAGDDGVLTIRQIGSTNNVPINNGYVGLMDFGLNNSLPVDLKVDSGAGRVTLDLRGMQLRSLDINSGVGEVVVMLPETGQYTVTADMGVGSLKIQVPKSLEASVSYDGGLSSINLPARFASLGEHKWKTSGFDGASNWVTLNLDTGVGSVAVVEQ